MTPAATLYRAANVLERSEFIDVHTDSGEVGIPSAPLVAWLRHEEMIEEYELEDANYDALDFARAVLTAAGEDGAQ